MSLGGKKGDGWEEKTEKTSIDYQLVWLVRFGLKAVPENPTVRLCFFFCGFFYFPQLESSSMYGVGVAQ